MRVPNHQPEEFTNLFPPKKVAVVKVRCLLQAAICGMSTSTKKGILPYYASLNIISDLFDGEFNEKAYKAIQDFSHRLNNEAHPCGEKIEGYISQMVQTIDKAHLLASN